MKGKRRQHSPEFKAKVALASLKGDQTANQLASEYDIHPLLVGQWKKAAMEGLADVFANRRAAREKDHDELTATLYQQIGQLKVELDWLKKSLACSPDVRRAWIEPDHAQISLRRQGELLDLARSTLYDEPVPESEENLLLLRLLDEQYTRTPS